MLHPCIIPLCLGEGDCATSVHRRVALKTPVVAAKLTNKTLVRIQAAEVDAQVMRYTKETAAFCMGILPVREGIKQGQEKGNLLSLAEKTVSSRMLL